MRERIKNVLKESGYLDDTKKPDVLGLFDEIQTAGQDFLYLVKLLRNDSNNDKYIMSEMERIIQDCLRTGDLETFVSKVDELKERIREAY